VAGIRRLGSQVPTTSGALRRSQIPKASVASKPPPLEENLKSLGADLRNDLNNPLQEIVAMVFVAKAGGGSSQGIQQALDAIDKAAGNMTKLVKGLEEKIRKAIY
jgi:hypothetical protein